MPSVYWTLRYTAEKHLGSEMAKEQLYRETTMTTTNHLVQPLQSPLWLVTKPGSKTPTGLLGAVYTDRYEALQVARDAGEVVIELQLAEPVEPLITHPPQQFRKGECPECHAKWMLKSSVPFTVKYIYCKCGFKMEYETEGWVPEK